MTSQSLVVVAVILAFGGSAHLVSAQDGSLRENYETGLTMTEYKKVFALKDLPPRIDRKTEFDGAANSLRALVDKVMPGIPLNTPLVVFVGVGSVNKTVLMKCAEKVKDAVPNTVCKTWRHPFEVGLGDAKEMAVAFIEDADAKYDTVIDIEFKRSASAVDYEEYYPIVRREDADTPPVVSVGVKRVSLRDEPGVVQVAFTRQSATYGARQWIRVFRQSGVSGFSLGGSVLIPALPVSLDRVTAVERATPDGNAIAGSFIETESARRVIFGAVSFRFPRRKDIIEDTSGKGWRALARVTPPNFVLGIGLPWEGPKAIVAAADIPVLVDRLSIFLGVIRRTDQELPPGLAQGSRVPSGFEAPEKTGYHFLFGLGIDLLHSR
jgi:hypothetical protein